MLTVHLDLPAPTPICAVTHDAPAADKRGGYSAVVGPRYVTAVIAGRVMIVPRRSVTVGVNGELTLNDGEDL